MTSCLPDGKNRHIFADQEDMTADMTTITYFTSMVKIVALKFNTPSQPKKFGSLLSVLSDLECYLYKRKYFNQNLLKLCYMLSQTDISLCNISARSDHGLPQNVISVFTFAPCCDQYRLRKNVRDFFTI